MQNITVDLIPLINAPAICHASQDDDGRQIQITLTENGAPYNLTGAEVLTLKQNTGAGITNRVVIPNPSGDKIIFIVSANMSAVPGQTLCELEITNNSQKIGSANFILKIEPLPKPQRA